MGKICKSLVLAKSYESRWTAGRIKKIGSDCFATIRGYDLLISDVRTGDAVCRLAAEPDADDAVFDYAVDPGLRYAVTSHVSQLLKLWIREGDEWEVAAQWKCPGKFPAYVLLDPAGQTLVCATAAGSCYVFLLSNQSLVTKYQTISGDVSAMAFDTAGNLWVGCVYGGVTLINTERRKASRITDESTVMTSFGATDEYVLAGGSDGVLLAFDGEGNVVIRIGVGYTINDLAIDPKNQNMVYIATEDGIKRVNIAGILEQDIKIAKINPMVANQILYFDELFAFDSDGILQSLGKTPRYFALSYNQIYDVAYDETEDVIAIAPSSSSFLIVLFQGGKTYRLYGHKNLPLALAASNGLLLSGSKDTNAMVWSLEEKKLLTVLVGHTEPVTAVAFVPKSDCVLTASSDKTLKLWKPTNEPEIRSALSSVIAHEKDINSVTVSLDGKLVATGSQDKTAKLWKIDKNVLSPVRSFIGHKRGVSCVSFSPVERVLVTAGSDKSVRIWSIDDGSCLSTFTEFSSPVFCTKFTFNGLQIITGESSGAIKVLRVKTGAPDYVNDSAHSQRVCGIAFDDKYNVLTCGEDGRLCIWNDNSEELEQSELAAKAEAAEAQQELKNAVKNGEYVRALQIAFKYRMPNNLRIIIRDITEQGLTALLDYFSEVEEVEDYEQWIDYISKWATNSRWADDATSALSSILKVKPPKFFTSHSKSFESKIDAIIPYLERHLTRLNNLSVQSYAIDDVLNTISIE